MQETSNNYQDGEKVTKVKVTFSPYNNANVRKLLMKIQEDFGHDNKRWTWHAINESENTNDWIVEFVFFDPNDALVFALKNPLLYTV